MFKKLILIKYLVNQKKNNKNYSKTPMPDYDIILGDTGFANNNNYNNELNNVLSSHKRYLNFSIKINYIII